jgi:hypothetical protein
MDNYQIHKFRMKHICPSCLRTTEVWRITTDLFIVISDYIPNKDCQYHDLLRTISFDSVFSIYYSAGYIYG